MDRPISHEPPEDCFNLYYTREVVRGYRAWLGAEARRFGIPIIDLSQTLLPRDFVDSMHPNARGRRKAAGALSAPLVVLLRPRIAEALSPAGPH